MKQITQQQAFTRAIHLPTRPENRDEFLIRIGRQSGLDIAHVPAFLRVPPDRVADLTPSELENLNNRTLGLIVESAYKSRMNPRVYLQRLILDTEPETCTPN